MNRLYIFTEAGKEIGLGHITRCTSLYDAACKQGYTCQLIVYTDMDKINQLTDRDHKLIDWYNKDFIESIVAKEDYCIVDSYLADYSIYEAITKKAKDCIFIDDTARIEYPAQGTVVNPSLYPYDMYLLDDSKRHYAIGSKYIILRDAFNDIKEKDCQKNVSNVLVIFGGSDIRNLASKITDLLSSKYKNITFNVVSSKYENCYNKDNINHFTELNASEIKNLMLDSDIAITGAGQTVYELIITKTPFIPIEVINNQKNNINGLKKFNLIEKAIRYDDRGLAEKTLMHFESLLDYENRTKLIKRYDIIDSKGSSRIINIFNPRIDIENIRLRNIRHDDCYDVLKLSNEDYVRQRSISKEKILWKDHIVWFEKNINSSQNIFYVVTDEFDSFLGQIRYGIDEEYAVVSISFTKKILGKGLSVKLLKMSMDMLRNTSNKPIKAQVFNTNISSMKLFLNAGFIKESEQDGISDLYYRKSVV